MHSFEQDPTLHEIQYRLDHAERAGLARGTGTAQLSRARPHRTVHTALRGFLKPLRRP